MPDARIALQIPLIWQHVRCVREAISSSLGSLSQGVRDAAAMSAAELIENAIKYGEEVPSMPSIEFAIETTADEITITVKNGCRNAAGVDRLLSMIEQLRAAEDPAKLYLDRLQELMQNPAESGQVGIYRIGFEGRFRLTCEYDGEVVHVRGVRRVDDSI